MQGRRSGAGRNIALLSLFATAFAAGAVVTFTTAALSGSMTGIARLPQQYRVGAAAAVLIALAVVDVVASRGEAYCPIGWRRQTPQSYAYHYPPGATLTLWGFDTGLAFTTFRVAALTWAALLLTILGFASWRTGFAYAAGFVLPLVVVLRLTPRTERYLAFLHARPAVQLFSAFLMCGSAAILLTEVMK